jgi:uncharacterized protein YdaU (DUF1376 family)
VAEHGDSRGQRRSSPRLPVWVDDTLAHIAETQEPTLATGARLRLWLIAYRRGGRLRADDKQLARMSGTSGREWTRVRPYIIGGWIYDPETDTYIIRRIVEELERVGDASAKAKASAECRWKTQRCDRIASAVQTQCDGNASPSPSPSPSPALKKAPPTPSRPPDSSVRASAHPGETPEPKPGSREGPILTPEQTERIDQLRRRVQASSALRPHHSAIDRVLLEQLRDGAPFAAVEKALVSMLEHAPNHPAAYLAKILRVEAPNAHEAASVERAKAGTIPRAGAVGILAAIANRKPGQA